MASPDSRPIVVATNFGVGSRAGLDHAIALGQAQSKSVIALHVFEPPRLPRTSESRRMYQQLHSSRRERSYRDMRAWLDAVSLDDVLVWIEPGNPEEVLIDTTTGASCLVIGTCNRFGVAARVSRRARCPVHVVVQAGGG